MFLGIRDIFFAKGRFALIASVVGLLTLLLVMLTGLTGGLGRQNTAALESLGADHIVFGVAEAAENPQVSFTSSEITAATVLAWQSESGIASASPLGVAQTKLESTHAAASAAVFGVEPGSNLLSKSGEKTLSGSADLSGNSVILPQSVADNAAVSVGDTVILGGVEVKVTGITTDTYYSHQPVIWASTETWQQVSHSAKTAVGTVVAVSAPSLSNDQLQAIAQKTHTEVTSLKGSFAGLPAYTSEQGSLKAMQGFLYGISALVTVSFLTVWTIQRTRDLAVMRALGSSTGYLLRDALTQAALVLAIGAIIGAIIGAGLGALVDHAVPFERGALTVVGPAAGIWLLGLAGSLIATARVTTVDPMIALGGN